MKKNNNVILLITLSNIGDAVMTTPVLQALHQSFPNSKIDIICDKRSDQIFKYCPFRGDLIQKNKQAGIIETVRLLMSLRDKKYDLIVDLRTDGLAYLLRSSKRLTKRQIDKQKKHAVEQHFSVINSLQLGICPPPTTIWLDKAHHAYAHNALGELPGSRWLAIGPGCDVPEKVWPGERYCKFVEQCSDLFDAIILVGSQRDIKYADVVMKELTHKCINLCGKTDLLQVAAILKCAKMFVGNDSGLGHVASAVSTPSISLFGIGSPERYHPWGKQAKWLRGNEQNINNITVEQVEMLLRSHIQQIYSST